MQKDDPIQFKRYKAIEDAGKQASEETAKLERYLAQTSGKSVDWIEFSVKDAIRGIANCISDPMWPDHAEVSKTNLKRWHTVLHAIQQAFFEKHGKKGN